MRKIFSFLLVLLMAVTSSFAAEMEPANYLGKGKFSVSNSKLVYLATSNLVYTPSTNRMSFQQYPWGRSQFKTSVMDSKSDIDSYIHTYNGSIDLFCWGGTGYANSPKPYEYFENADSYAYGVREGHSFHQLYTFAFNNNGTIENQYTDNFDWPYMFQVTYQTEGSFTSLTKEEWYYLINQRTNHAKLIAMGTVEGVEGLILLPDNWHTPFEYHIYTWDDLGDKKTENGYYYVANRFTSAEWTDLANAGAIFLPAANRCIGTKSKEWISSYISKDRYQLEVKKGWYGNHGWYWTGTSANSTETEEAQYFHFAGNAENEDAMTFSTNGRNNGYAVRLAGTSSLTPSQTGTINKGTINLTLDINTNKVTWKGHTFTKPGTYYYTELEAEGHKDYLYTVAVHSLGTYHDVNITFEHYYLLNTDPNWDSEHIGEYILQPNSCGAVNKTVKVKQGMDLKMYPLESDFFQFKEYRISHNGNYSTTKNQDTTITINGDIHLRVVVTSKDLHPKGVTSNKTYGIATGEMGPITGTTSFYSYPNITMEYLGNRTEYPDGWYMQYIAQTYQAGKFVGWIPEKWIAQYGSAEEALAIADYLKGIAEGVGYTDVPEYLLLKKFENPTFTINKSELEFFANYVGVTDGVFNGMTEHYLSMYAVFEAKPIEYNIISIKSEHGEVYDYQGHTKTCADEDCKEFTYATIKTSGDDYVQLLVRNIDDGWQFDHWEVNGVDKGSSLPYLYCPYNATIKEPLIEAVYVETQTPPTPTTYKVFVISEHGTIYDRNGEVLSTYMGDPCFYAGGTLSLDVKNIDEGWEFDHWVVDGTNVGDDLPYSLTPDEDNIIVEAVYSEVTTPVTPPVSGLDDTYVCDFTTAVSKNSNYTNSWTYDSDWTVFGGANNNGQWDYAKMGGKSGNLANANPVYVVNNTAFDKEIKGVKVYYRSGSLSKNGMDVNEWGVKVYSDASCSTLLYTAASTDLITGDEESFSVYPGEGQTWSPGNYIQVYWDLVNSTSTNGIIFVNKIAWQTKQVGTDIESVQPSAVSVQKIIRNGVLYIIRDGKTYNIMGMEVK